MGKIYLFGLLCFLLSSPFSASADDGRGNTIPGYPGWQLAEVKPEEGETEQGVVYSRGVFFTLKPPDKRPTISITERLGKQVLNDEIGPEAAYTGSAGEPKKTETDGNGSGVSTPAVVWGGNGFQSGPAASGEPVGGIHPSLFGNGSGGHGSGAGSGAGSSAGGTGGGGDSSGSSSIPGSAGSGGSGGSGGTGVTTVSTSTDTGKPKITSVDTGSQNACPAATVDHCNLASDTGSGYERPGTCAPGFSGACIFTCSNGAWKKSSNSCSSAAAVQPVAPVCQVGSSLQGGKCVSNAPPVDPCAAYRDVMGAKACAMQKP